MAESVKAKKSGELTEKQERFRRFLAQGAREGAVIALIALCIYLGMALVTFSLRILVGPALATTPVCRITQAERAPGWPVYYVTFSAMSPFCFP